MAENVNVVDGVAVNATPGSAGLNTQLGGQPATVSTAAEATGGLASGNFIQTDLDEELFKFKSDDTPLMSLMLKAKKVNVKSPEVKHYMIDEPKSFVVTNTRLEKQSTTAAKPLDVDPAEIGNIAPHSTLLVKGVLGADGGELMLFVTGISEESKPIVRAVNGDAIDGSEYTAIPEIPAGTKCVILSNALYETQKEVDPDMIVPQPTEIFLQKRGMNQIVSDYFEHQKKEIPFSKALIAETAITNFKVRGNRTLWAGRKGKFKVNVPKLGMQYVYFTEGIRWQFKRELQHTGVWTVEKIIALAKMFFTGEDVPKTALLLAGKNLLEEIQCIDYSKHPEVQITTKVNAVGWTVTNFHTVFGDIEIKREPTLDRLGWSNSGALIGENRLVHYQYSAEHSFNDRVDGEEATRNGMLVWDGLGLKGSCHIWIDGENNATSANSTGYMMVDEVPAEPVDGMVYYLLKDMTLGTAKAQSGQLWQYKDTKWSEFKGDVYAQ